MEKIIIELQLAPLNTPDTPDIVQVFGHSPPVVILTLPTLFYPPFTPANVWTILLPEM